MSENHNQILQLIYESGLVVKIVLLILCGFSISSWAIIFTKYPALRRAKKESDYFLDIFWNSKKLDTVFESTKKITKSPISEVFRAGYIELVNLKTQEASHPDENKELSKNISGIDNINRALRRAGTFEITNLEKLVSFLATTGSTAPFIGLFGTVWGIMDSFINIGNTKDTSLAVVAPGISEALVATAVGLFAAIPAVVFYNIFLSKIKVISNEIDNFSSDFLNILKRHFF